MHTLKLNIKDSVLEKVLYFLQNLPKDDVKIVENKVIENSNIDENYETQDGRDTAMFSNHSANIVNEWKDESEDKIWM